MEVSHDFLKNIALVLVVAGLVALVFQRLRMPVVFGYIAAGVLIGPHFPYLPVVADEPTVHTLSELGVILLMFALGLEFSLRTLVKIAPTAGVIAVAQSSALVLVGYLIGQAFGWTTMESVFAGAIIAISSTTIIAKAFEEHQVRGTSRDIVLGVLIVEDLIAIMLLALLTTTTSGQDGLTMSSVGATAARLTVFLVGFLAIGLLVIPRLVRYSVQRARPETTVVAGVGISFAAALIALSFGYSVALGAFFAGALAAESGVATTVEHLIQPVRDMFAAIFFVAVGMLIQPQLILDHWLAVLVLTVVVIVGKVVAVSVSSFLTGYSVSTSVRAGMSLAQIGEFSFIIASMGLATGAIRPFLYPVAVAVSAITTLTTPWLIRFSGQFANYVDRKLPKPLQTFVALYGGWIDGLRVNRSKAKAGVGRLVAFILADLVLMAALVIGIALELPRLTALLGEFSGLSENLARYAVIGGGLIFFAPLMAGLVRSGRFLAERLAMRALPGVVQGVDYGAAPRRALVTALQLGIIVLSGIVLVSVTQPFLPPFRGVALLLVLTVILAIAFWRSATNLHGHARAGAEILAVALAERLVPQTDGAPAEQHVPAPAEPPRPETRISEMLPGFGEPTAYRLDQDSPALDRSLAELNLRGATGATVLAIRRADDEVLLPTGREKLKLGDMLVLAGTHDSIEAARRILMGDDDDD